MVQLARVGGGVQWRPRSVYMWSLCVEPSTCAVGHQQVPSCILHRTLPRTAKVVPLGLGTPFTDPLREHKGHIRSTFREPLRGTSLGARVLIPNPEPPNAKPLKRKPLNLGMSPLIFTVLNTDYNRGGGVRQSLLRKLWTVRKRGNIPS